MKTCGRCGGAILTGVTCWGGPTCYCKPFLISKNYEPITTDIQKIEETIAYAKELRALLIANMLMNPLYKNKRFDEIVAEINTRVPAPDFIE